MKGGNSRRKDLLADLLISLASGAILALGAKALAAVVLPDLSEWPANWPFVAAAPVAALLVFFFTRHLYGGADRAFVVVSAFTQTRWLGDLLDHLSRVLDRHGIDMVVKLSPHDHSGRSQLAHLTALRRRRRSYVGGFIVPAQPEAMESELTAFCRAVHRPVVFMDVRPFPVPKKYPPDTTFVGCDPNEIGAKAARWVAKEMTGRGVESPSVLVLGGDSQAGRQTMFAERLKELLPSAETEVNLLGLFSRERTREIVGHHLRRLRPGGRVNAIFCTNDEMALGTVDAVQEHEAAGGRLDDLVIIGVDGIAEAIAVINVDATPFRATIQQDPRRIAEVAVDALLKMRSGERVPQEIFIPASVYPRQ
ncbi:hypothetical protein GCM10017673_57280 [Streptosporangium violaceochromogenes]|nr:hypothetical protein GCM10017673_57280 [Streptosporangium violaceochromogenes]